MSEEEVLDPRPLSPPPSAPPVPPVASTEEIEDSCDSEQSPSDEPELIGSLVSAAVDAENTPPSCDKRASSASPRHYHHHRPHYQQFHHQAYRHLTIDAQVMVDAIHHLPLSPSMTPPIVLSPAGSTADAEEHEEDSDQAQLSDHESVSGDMKHEEQEPDPSRSPSPLLSRSRSLRGSHRFSPYHRRLPRSLPASPPHQSVLRPINGETRHRSPSPSCDSTVNTANVTTLDQSDSEDATTEPKDSANPMPAQSHPALLHIDTQLANRESAHAHQESRAAKTALAKRIFHLIDQGDYESFIATLAHQKPDLNVFIDGQTALHTCLLRGRDVSWCKQLVLYGANPNLSNQEGWNPLHLAASNLDNLRYLISCNSVVGHHGHLHRHHHNHSTNSTTPSPTRH